MIGGWADGYTNTIFRMGENLSVPWKIMVGPWMHTSPNNATPGPSIDFLHEICRWWAHWLRDEDTGMLVEPRVALYIQDGAPPVPYETLMPGSWRFYDNWPPAGIDHRPFFLENPNKTSGLLSEQASQAGGVATYKYLATVGTGAGAWCAVMGIDGITRDQAVDDARSLTYTSPLLDDPLEILGAPKAILHVSSSAEVAFFCVKLNDIFPDGSSRLVCRGILNATRRLGKANPIPLTPGEVYQLEIPLKHASWTFQEGHRLRVSISSSDWPWVWPSPTPATNQLFWGVGQESQIILPVVTEKVVSAQQVQFADPIELPQFLTYESAGMTYEFTNDLIKGFAIHKTGYGGKSQAIDTPFSRESDSLAEIGASDEHPDEAYAKAFGKASIIRGIERIDIVANTTIRSTAAEFLIDIELKVEKDGAEFYKRNWSETFPRLLL
jgi:hypothetical protein